MCQIPTSKQGELRIEFVEFSQKVFHYIYLYVFLYKKFFILLYKFNKNKGDYFVIQEEKGTFLKVFYFFLELSSF